jgi:hypothetical protein
MAKRLINDDAFTGIQTYYDYDADQKAMAKWLNDPDNRAFRTRPGTI